MKMGKYSFKRGITLHFGEKYASHPLPICDEQTVCAEDYLLKLIFSWPTK